MQQASQSGVAGRAAGIDREPVGTGEAAPCEEAAQFGASHECRRRYTAPGSDLARTVRLIARDASRQMPDRGRLAQRPHRKDRRPARGCEDGVCVVSTLRRPPAPRLLVRQPQNWAEIRRPCTRRDAGPGGRQQARGRRLLQMLLYRLAQRHKRSGCRVMSARADLASGRRRST